MTNIVHSFIYLLKRGMFTIITLLSPFKRKEIIRVQFERDRDGFGTLSFPLGSGQKPTS